MFPLIQDNVFTVSVLPHLAWTSSPWLISMQLVFARSVVYTGNSVVKEYSSLHRQNFMCSVLMSFPATRNKDT